MNNPNRWHFTLQTNAHGYAYIYAYQTAWDPLTKRSRRVKKMYVGRLHEDSRVDISEKFAQAMPAYAKGEFYFSKEKRLVEKAEFFDMLPAAPTATPRKAEKPTEPREVPSTRMLGVIWAAQQIAQQCGLLKDLEACFGPKAQDLFHLALYSLNAGNSIAAYDDWRQLVALPEADELDLRSINGLLVTIKQADIEKFFRLRLDRLRGSDARLYAFDNTSYSRTSDFPYDQSALHLINSTFVCDQSTGEAVFAHAYEGAMDDGIALEEIAFRLKNMGLRLVNTVLVTDRDALSFCTPKKADADAMPFIQSVPCTEALQKQFDHARESLCSLQAFNAKANAYVQSFDEANQKGLHLHLYRFSGVDEAKAIGIVTQAEDLIRLKRENAPVSPVLWAKHSDFLRKRGNVWERDNQAIMDACRYAGMFALRSNAVVDAAEALRMYELRSAIAQDFTRMMNGWAGAQHSAKTSAGRLLVVTLAISLRLMMLCRIRSNRDLTLSVSTEELNDIDTIEGALLQLEGILADKRPKAHAWVPRTLTDKERDMLTMLGIPFPPQALR